MSTQSAMIRELKRMIRSFHNDKDDATFKCKLESLASDKVHPVECARVVNALQRYVSAHIHTLPDELELQRIVHELLK